MRRRAPRLVEAAQRAGREGRRDEALRLARLALERHPNDPQCLEWRARRLAAAGRLSDSRRALDACVAEGGGYSALLLRSGVRLLRGEGAGGWDDLMRAYVLEPSFMFAYAEARPPRRVDADDALFTDDVIDSRRLLARLDALAALRPAPRWVLVWRGLVRRRARDYAGCVADLRAARARGERSPMALTWLGEARLQTGDRGGIADMERAAREGGRAWNYAWLARARMNFGRDRAALADLERAVRLEPRNGWYLAWRAEAKRLLGVRRGLLEDYGRALALDPGYGYQAWVRTWRGLAFMGLGRPARALRDFDAALAAKPGYPLAASGRARALKALARPREWIQALDAAARLDPKIIQALSARPPEESAADAALLSRLGRGAPPRARAWLGFFTLHGGEPQAALGALERAAAREPGWAWPRAWLGLALERLGRPAQAEREYARALKVEPKAALARAWRARTLLSRGRLDAALRELERSARDDDRYASVHADLGRLRLLAGRPREARTAFERAVSMDAGDPSLWVDFSEALRRCGDARAGAEALVRARSLDEDAARARLAAWSRA